MKHILITFLLLSSTSIFALSYSKAGSILVPEVGVNEIIIHPNAPILVALAKGRIVAYDLNTYEKLWHSDVYDYGITYTEGSIAFSNDGDFIIHGYLNGGGASRAIRVVDSHSGENLYRTEPQPNSRGPYISVSLSSNLKYGTSGEWLAENIDVWDNENQQLVKQIPFSGKIIKVGFDQTDRFVYAVSSKSVAIFNLLSSVKVASIDMYDLYGPRYGSHGPYSSGPATRDIIGAEFWPDLNYVAIHASMDLYVQNGDEQSEVFIIDLESSEVIAKIFLGTENFVRKIILSEDRRSLIVLVTDSYFKASKSKIIVWEIASRKIIYEGEGPEFPSMSGSRSPLNPARKIAVSKDGSVIASLLSKESNSFGRVAIFKKD